MEAELREARGHASHAGDGVLTCLKTGFVTLFITLILFAATTAKSAPMPRHWHATRWFLQAATCLHDHEGAWDANTGNGYYGGLQFLLSTWRRAGGIGYPHLASPREQIYRCWRIYLQDGRSFREWGTAGICGLR